MYKRQEICNADDNCVGISVHPNGRDGDGPEWFSGALCYIHTNITSSTRVNTGSNPWKCYLKDVSEPASCGCYLGDETGCHSDNPTSERTKSSCIAADNCWLEIGDNTLPPGTGAAGVVDQCSDISISSAPCPRNQRVASNRCVGCPAGTTNAFGDDPTGPDTSCTHKK